MKVLLCCSAGISTTLLMKRMEAYAREKGVSPFEIEVRGAGEAAAHAAGCDVVLLGPQVAYLERRVAEEAAPVPVGSIPMQDFARMDCPAIFGLIDGLIG